MKYFRVKVHGLSGYEFYVSSIVNISAEEVVDECQASGLFRNYNDQNFANVKEESYNVEHNYMAI